MAEGGRPWWKSSAVKRSPLIPNTRPSGETNDRIQPTIPSTPPKPSNLSVVKQETPGCRSRYPSFSPGARLPNTPNRNPVDCSRVKLEPLANIKSEPLAYIQKALIKGEFPSHFNWPVVKWEPVDGVPGVTTASIKGESKHYFPDFKQSVFWKLGNNVRRDRNRPPPNWRYIYSRQSYEPTASARVWWNGDVERVLKQRRDAYLLTKLNDHAPVEVRMERLWSFEVAKNEARRVINESKCRAGVGADLGYLNGVNVGASCSSQPNNNNLSSTTSMNAELPPNKHLDQLALAQNKESPRKDDVSSVTSDEIQILAKEKENIEVLTIDDEIEDALSISEDEDDIKIISENDSDVIFIQKKQGEVTIIAQIEGRMVKMNRKHKLCVTFQNRKSNPCITAVDTESSQDGNISITGETVSNVRVENNLQDTFVSSASTHSNLEKLPNGEGEMNDDDKNKDTENDSQDAVIDGSLEEERNIDSVATVDEYRNEVDKGIPVYEVSEDVPDSEIALIGEYVTMVSSVPSATSIVSENEEQNDILVDDGSEDEVLVLDSYNPVGKRTEPIKAVDEIIVEDSIKCYDNNSSTQETAVNDKDCSEMDLNVKSNDDSTGKNSTVELDETESEDEGSIVHVTSDSKDEKSESCLSDKTYIKLGEDNKAETLIFDDILETSLKRSQDSSHVETLKVEQSTADDDDEIKIEVTDCPVKDERGNSLQLAAGVSSIKKMNVQLPRRLTRQSILVSKMSCLDSQESEESSPSSPLIKRNLSPDTPRRQSRRRLAKEVKS